MATTGKLTHNVVLVMGDPGGDGHGYTDIHSYECNRTTPEVKKLYDVAVKKHGLDITGECMEYEDSELSAAFMEIFTQVFAGNQAVLTLVDDENCIGTEEHGEIFLSIAQLSDPELAWKRTYKDKATLNIGGYGHFYD